MKHENIKSQAKSAVLSACVSLAVRLVASGFLLANVFSIENSTIIYVAVWLFIVAISLQILFLPYSLWSRIKEIKKGEIYEASKY